MTADMRTKDDDAEIKGGKLFNMNDYKAERNGIGTAGSGDGSKREGMGSGRECVSLGRERASSKSNTAKLFRRYVWLVDLISRSGRITFEEINMKWRDSQLNEDGEDLPLKTFHNHKEAIQEMFGITIACARSCGYTYYVENADDLKTEGAKRWLLNSFAVGNIMAESKSLGNRILFEEIPSGQQFLTPLIEAMRDSKTVEITHKGFDRELAHTFEVEPYCVKVFRQRWYMAAYSKEHEMVRVYALDRIHNVNIIGNHFNMPDDFDPEEYFAYSFGVIVSEEKEAERVVLKVKGNQVKYLRTLPLHHSQIEMNAKALEELQHVGYSNLGQQGNLQGNQQAIQQGNQQAIQQGNQQAIQQGNLQGNQQGNLQDNQQGKLQGNQQDNRQDTLQGSRQCTQENQDYTYFQYYLYPTIDFQQELLAQCIKNEIEVLEPQWLRDSIREIGNGIVCNHKGYGKWNCTHPSVK